VGKFANHPLTKKLLGGWSDKLWWVHSEAVYVTLLGYELTGKDGLKRLYDQVHAYTFDTFPHPDPALGEWIQIRDRQGQPMDKVVALPVKDPFHITRNLLFLIELLRGVGRW
jgi:N-acylglucosamine 2-epimerase